MKQYNAGLVIAAIAVAGNVSSVCAATLTKLSSEENKVFSSCLGMKSEELEKDARCLAVIKKADVTIRDIERMRSCEQVFKDAPKDPDCAAMMKKHPTLVQGHGRVMESPGD